jgi:MoaA/NifB/PqqE/SkfB family radical SAM enzyme
MDFSHFDKSKLLKSAFVNLLASLSALPSSPPAVIWLLTYRCNLTCAHCDLWKRESFIDDKIIMAIANKIAESKASIVTLSGGEIFLVPNIKEVISLLKQSGKYIRINSNGFMMGEYIDFLLANEIDSIVISVDANDAAHHDKARGKFGLFDRIVGNLKYIKEKRREDKPFTAVRCVIMKSNLDKLDEYISFFENISDEVTFQPIHNDVSKHAVLDSRLLFDPKDEDHVRHRIGNLVKDHSFLNNDYFINIPEFLFHPERVKKDAVNFCLPVLFNTIVIDPCGNCLICRQIIGNIIEDTLAHIWSSPKKKDFLKRLARSNECETPCWLNCSSAKTATIGFITKYFIKLMR